MPTPDSPSPHAANVWTTPESADRTSCHSSHDSTDEVMQVGGCWNDFIHTNGLPLAIMSNWRLPYTWAFSACEPSHPSTDPLRESGGPTNVPPTRPDDMTVATIGTRSTTYANLS
ncbi:hypothetical protein RJ55_02609 [Drechmeria coniospora]|nr:hypothetical protein RJ55_02609 [Drechmeria coniospora]